ncbi:MAG: protein kinase, partial [Myxococcota bacterium]
KIADFGVASHDQATDELPRGKLPYMAPELFGSNQASEKVDLFAVGVMLWELLTGRHLFRGRSPQEVIAQVCAQPRIAPSRLTPGIPELLDNVVLSALAADANDRPESADDMQEALQQVLKTLFGAPAVTPHHVAIEIRAHLNAARLPNEALHENALGDIDAVLEPEPEEEPTDHGTQKPTSANDGEPDTTYAYIRPNQPASKPGPTTDQLLRAYLEEAPIPAPRGSVDTLDLTPGPTTRGEAIAMLSAGAYRGPHPIWLATPHGTQGPMRPARAFSYLREMAIEALPHVRISANNTRWITLARAAYLLDAELISPSLSLEQCEMQGRLADMSTTSILGTYAQGHTSARVMFARANKGTIERVEVEIVSGHAIGVHNNNQFFDLWHNLLDNPFLAKRGLNAAFHQALTNDRRVVRQLPADVQLAYQQACALSQRRALEAVFTWSDGQFGSNKRVRGEADSPSLSLMRMLPRLVARRTNIDILQRRLAQYFKRPLYRSLSFSSDIDKLQLRRTERQRAEAFGNGRTLFESLESANRGRIDIRYSQVLAYLLIELGLLHDRPPIHVSSVG